MLHSGKIISDHLIERDKRKRLTFLNTELSRSVLKSIALDRHLPLAIRWSSALELHCLPGQRTKIHNRCILSARARSINRKYRLSRLTFRKLASMGYLPGVMKSSW